MGDNNAQIVMTVQFRDSGGAGMGDILAFLDEAARNGNDAEVPAACLPVLTDCAGCRPTRGEGGERVFVFRLPGAIRERTGLCERVAAALLALLFTPLFIAVALLIFAVDGPPVLFRQERYGVAGRPFRLFKFRTMVRRSEDLQEKLQRMRGQQGRLFKLTRDPRVTRTGGFLRRTFIDELPQLVNVIRGEMRLVGPRPLPASDREHYTRPCHQLRLKGLPGMTGLWQVAGRNARTFDEMCLLDYYSLCNRSAAADLRIIGLTAGLLLKQACLKSKAEDGGQ